MNEIRLIEIQMLMAQCADMVGNEVFAHKHADDLLLEVIMLLAEHREGVDETAEDICELYRKIKKFYDWE